MVAESPDPAIPAARETPFEAIGRATWSVAETRPQHGRVLTNFATQSTLPLVQVHDALDRHDQIHAQLDRAEVYRGFRVPAVALVGVLGLSAAAIQPHVDGVERGTGFVTSWAVVAAVGGLVGTAAGVRSYLVREDAFDRRRTRRVLAQFLPCIVAGGAVTAA